MPAPSSGSQRPTRSSRRPSGRRKRLLRLGTRVSTVCGRCGKVFSCTRVVDGKRRHLKGRKLCLECHPFRARRSPRVIAPRPVRSNTCASCGKTFAAKQMIGGRLRALYRRSFCLDCSPFGGHNTSRSPLGGLPDADGHRRKRRNASWLRYQEKRRRNDKARLVELRGGLCQGCGYSAEVAALEFHHRNRTDKAFTVGSSTRQWERLVTEAAK